MFDEGEGMVILSGAQQSRRISRINQLVTPRDSSTSLGMTALLPISILAEEEFHDIAPPIDYSLISPWVIFLGVFVALTVIGLIVWFVLKSFRRPTPPQPPRERALTLLEQIRTQITAIDPYRFSIRVSDILRHYVTEQFGLPVTRQTSVEFLNGLRGSRRSSLSARSRHRSPRTKRHCSKIS